MRRLFSCLLPLVVLPLAVASGCGQPADAAAQGMVFAASSLRRVTEDLAAAFAAANPGMQVMVHSAGSPRLVMQLEEGAAADVLITADEASMDRASAGGTVRPTAVLVQNRLALLVPTRNPQELETLEDLTRPNLQVLLCGPGVPAGRYGRLALEAAGLVVRSVSDAPSAAAVAAKVALGEVDVGLGYATDGGDAVLAVPLPLHQQVPVSCPIGLVDGGQAAAVGRAFVAFVKSEAGQRILRDAGFGAR